MAKFGTSIHIDGDIYANHRVDALQREKSYSQDSFSVYQRQAAEHAKQHRAIERLAARNARNGGADTYWPNLSNVVDAAIDKAEKMLDQGLRQATEIYTYHAERARYENDVVDLLSRIRSTGAGRALLNAIERSPHWTRIIPYMPRDKDWNNGSNRPHYVQNATREGHLVRDAKGRIETPERRGQGLGTLTIISFITPALAARLNFYEAVAVQKHFERPDATKLAQPDEILVHELTHALRARRGVIDRRTVPKQSRYGTYEEFFAIVVANIYRSEIGRKGVRNDNHGAMQLTFMSDKEFISTEKNRRHLRQFRRDHRQLFSDLKSVKAEFNPLQRMALN